MWTFTKMVLLVHVVQTRSYNRDRTTWLATSMMLIASARVTVEYNTILFNYLLLLIHQKYFLYKNEYNYTSAREN